MDPKLAMLPSLDGNVIFAKLFDFFLFFILSSKKLPPGPMTHNRVPNGPAQTRGSACGHFPSMSMCEIIYIWLSCDVIVYSAVKDPTPYKKSSRPKILIASL